MGGPQKQAAQAAARSAADRCFVLVERGSRSDVRWSNSQVDLNASVQTHQITVQSFMRCEGGYRVGLASCPWEAGWTDAVEEADAMAQHGPVFDEAPNDIAPPATGDEAEAGEWMHRSLLGQVQEVLAGPRQTSWSGYGGIDRSELALAASTGWSVTTRRAQSHCELQGRQSGRAAWAASAASSPDGLDVAGLQRQIERRLEWGARRVTVPPGRYDTLLEPACVADLMLHLYWSAGASQALAGQSPFGDSDGRIRLGDRMVDEALRLGSAPGDALAAMPAVVTNHSSSADRSVFDNGLAVEPVDWIVDGRLRHLPTSRRSAERGGLAFAPWSQSLMLEHREGKATSEDLVGHLDEGLIVSSLWYTRDVDPARLQVTGLTRDGVFYVRGGEIVGEVGNFRFNDSSLGVLDRIAAAGASRRTFGREGGIEGVGTVMPPLVVHDFQLTSATKAV